MQPKAKNVQKYFLAAKPTGDPIPQEIIRNSMECRSICTRIHRAEGNNFQEFFYLVFLNHRNKVTGYYLASMGGITATIVDIRLILKAAVLANCTSIILCHNHPSGNIQPSIADEEITKKIKQAATLVDIKVLDHIIICEDDEYFSFSDSGLM